MLRFLLRRIILMVCGLQLQLISCVMYEYDVEFHSNTIFSPCDEYPGKDIDKYFDTSGLQSVPQDGGSLTLQGTLVLVTAFKRPRSKAYCELLKRERGVWQKTIYSMFRNDVCQAIFNPTEMWSPYLEQVPVNYRKCPFANGMSYNISISTKEPVRLPDRNMVGEYNIHCEVGDKSEEDFICTNAPINLYRR